ncbi:GTPase HflX [Maricaulis sp.]|uniref:GTPase HflX n=1 Tax=Maricaulis sp. TaxID=1486257 RepID=UPI0026215E22|nr:GTPase HflX [Maricaulis sp.]
MIEREAPVTRATVIHPGLRDHMARADARLEEASGLAEALDMELAEAFIVPLRKIEPGRFFGRGKVDELKLQLKQTESDVVVIDASLTPIQQRNLEKAWQVKVVDRTGLILEIFGQRARTKEGVLQVELARLAYERSRLVRTWTHLERQRGGRGFLAGPGETQIETDRRLLADKMAKLRRQLDDVRRTRALHRKTRQDTPFPTVALVGYTNAGKSTLFNTLTGAKVLARDMPFATLDPTVRAVKLPRGMQILLSDTVGFITDLPTELIAAFRATLEEVRDADILIHVIDASDPDLEGRVADVEGVLKAIEAGREFQQPVIEAWNKSDLLSADDFEEVELECMLANRKAGQVVKLPISAVEDINLDALLATIETALAQRGEVLHLTLPPHEGRAIAWLLANGDVLREVRDDETGVVEGDYRLSTVDAGRFRAQFPHLAAPLPVDDPYEV